MIQLRSSMLPTTKSYFVRKTKEQFRVRLFREVYRNTSDDTEEVPEKGLH